MANIFLVLILALLASYSGCTSPNACVEQSPCLCSLSSYSKIDIAKLIVDKDPKQPTFLEDKKSNANQTSTVTYYFHGCTDAVFDSDQHGIPKISNHSVSITGSLIRYEEGKEPVGIGNASQLRFEPANPDANEFVYKLLFKNGSIVTATIHLICDNFNQPLLKVINTDTHELALASPHVCVMTEHPGMSTGSVLLVLFLIVALGYLVGGAAVLYLMRGARGLEMIPNIDFWRGLPGLVKDGIIFLFSGCNSNAVTTAETYDRI